MMLEAFCPFVVKFAAFSLTVGFSFSSWTFCLWLFWFWAGDFEDPILDSLTLGSQVGSRLLLSWHSRWFTRLQSLVRWAALLAFLDRQRYEFQIFYSAMRSYLQSQRLLQFYASLAPLNYRGKFDLRWALLWRFHQHLEYQALFYLCQSQSCLHHYHWLLQSPHLRLQSAVTW